MISIRAVTMIAAGWVCCLLCVQQHAAHAGVITATNAQFANVDGGILAKRPVTFLGSEPGFALGAIADVNITIEFAKADGTNPNPPYPTTFDPFFNEINFELISPNGTSVMLIPVNTFPGAPATNAFNGLVYDGTITLDDEAAQTVNIQAMLAGMPNSGAFRPVNPLSAFDGLNALGTWQLWIGDEVGDDTLRFRSYTLTITTVPEPTSWACWGLAMGALVLLRRPHR